MDVSQLSSPDLKAIAGGDISKVSTEGLKMLTTMPQAAPATASPPSAPVNPQPQAGGGDGIISGVRNMADDFGDTALAGIPDEVGAKIATGAEYLGGVLTPGKGRDLSDINAQNEGIRQKQQTALGAFNDAHPWLDYGSKIAGGLTTIGPLSKLIGAGAGAVADALPEIPGVTSALQKFAAASPKAANLAKTAGTVSATGAGVGALSSGIQAPAGDTEDASEEGAGVGALFGLGAKYGLEPLANKAVGMISPAIKGAKAGVSALQDFFRSSEEEAETAAGTQQTPPQATAPISNLTDEPIGTSPVQGAMGPSSLTGKLPLSPGQSSGDIDTMRREEDARQGVLGTEAENKIKASDAGLAKTAMQVGQQLKGKTNAPSQQLLEDSIQQFQDAGNVAHAAAGAKYDALNQAAAITTLAKNKVGPSLGADLSDVVNDPANQSAFKSNAGAPARALYQQFKDLITGTEGNELPFNDLQAWRQDVSAVANQIQKSPATVAAGRLGEAYDNWMGTKFSQNHVISGDPEVAQKAQDAATAWKNYKTTFDAKASPFVSGQPKPFDALPADLVTTVAGKTGFGTQTTALKIRGMADALPDPPPPPQMGNNGAPGPPMPPPITPRQQFKNNVFAGFISRAFEGVNGDTVALGTLKNNLRDFQQSQVYQEQFANDPSKHVVLTNLVNDLTSYQKAIKDRTVVAPSGGAVIRGIQKIVGGVANTPVIGHIVPFAKELDSVVNKAGDMRAASVDRAAFNKAMKAQAQQIHTVARSGQVFDINSLKAGLAGGLVSGNMVQQNNGGTK